MAHSMPDLFAIHLEGKAINPARTEMQARQHLVTTDEPKERGGKDQAATPLETMLSAFLGCTNVITHFVAGTMGIKIHKLEMSLVGQFDTRGVFGKAEVRVPFPDIALSIDLESNADDAKIENLRNAVAEKCPVSVILRQAGCRISESWVNTQKA